MSIVVTGSAGHLGEGIVRTLRDAGRDVLGVDILDTPFTDRVGSIVDRGFVADCLKGAQAVIHAAALHKPHVATHTRQDFVDVNVTGTLNLLEEATAAGVGGFVFVSTTSVFGSALTPPPGAPAAWITEEVVPVPKNIYGVTKAAAEDLCELFHKKERLPCVVLRTSRFFPEEDDNKAMREAFADDNAKANELLFRRVDLEDAVDACLLAVERAPAIGFARYVVSATTPFTREDLQAARDDAPGLLRRRYPQAEELFSARGWSMFPSIDRVYVNARAREALGWRPRWDFARVLDCLAAGADVGSDLARAVGSKGYHDTTFEDGPYPVE